MTQCIKKRFVIVKKPRCSTIKKRPMAETHDAVITLLRELRAAYPTASLTLIELTWDDDIWPTDGDEALRTHDLMVCLKPKRIRS